MGEPYRGKQDQKVLGVQLSQGTTEILSCCNTLSVGFLPVLPDFTWKAFIVAECFIFKPRCLIIIIVSYSVQLSSILGLSFSIYVGRLRGFTWLPLI